MNAPRQVITFKPGGMRFTYRVGGVLIQQEHVLCQSASEEGFFFLPGGRAEVGESARVSLLRETQEELGEALQVGRLLYVVENFFSDDRGAWHELGLYFLLSALAGSFLMHGLEPFTRQDEVGNTLCFDWLPLAHLEAFPLYPPFFQTALKDLPEHPVHIEEHRSRSEHA
ncbi:MAG TPA: NUDIX domain-containing protein [Ktedonobacteraceae bacterium]|nr:NUDIX domain-containing protein [Ktedonobacteraceae bacterium]